jgi:hypothetical protein
VDVEGKGQGLIPGTIPNFALADAIRKVKEKGGIRTDGAQELLVDDDDKYLLRENTRDWSRSNLV